MTRTATHRAPLVEPTAEEWDRAHDLIDPDRTPDPLFAVGRLAYAMAERRVWERATGLKPRPIGCA
jgi:hypothetical protein